MPMSVGVGGANRPVQNLYIGVGGVWRPAVRRFVGVGGEWKLVHDPHTVRLSPASVRGAGRRPLDSIAQALLRFNADGTLRASYTNTGVVQHQTLAPWCEPTPNNDVYDIMFIPQAGTFDTVPGQAHNTWLPLTQFRTVSCTCASSTNAGAGPVGGAVLVRIRDRASELIVAEANYSLSAVLYANGTSGGVGGGVNRSNDFYAPLNLA